MNKILNPESVQAYALYASFAASAFGGSHVGVVSDTPRIPYDIRQRIAIELGAPATCFVDAVGDGEITAQFFSPVAELPMCGHGTIGLMTRAVEAGWIELMGNDVVDVALNLPKTPTTVRLTGETDGRTRVMVSISQASLRPAACDPAQLAAALGVRTDDFDPGLPIEIADGDFVHLIVPMRGLSAVQRITPDFAAIISFCHEHGIETVATYSMETQIAENTVHVRDFCPAVGVAESAAAGTTNAALTGYLIGHDVVRADGDGRITVLAEQGLEINRPSRIRSEAEIVAGSIGSLRVGGVSNKIMDGSLIVPSC